MLIELQFQFRNPEKAREFDYLHPHLQRLFRLICHILNDMDFDVLVTSMIRPAGTIEGESGVHAVGRAIDFVPLRTPGGPNVSQVKMEAIAECINRLYPRGDKKPILMWHQVPTGGSIHFHAQVPATKDFVDLKGMIPKYES
jgi:hypothetical protein